MKMKMSVKMKINENKNISENEKVSRYQSVIAFKKSFDCGIGRANIGKKRTLQQKKMSEILKNP